MSNALGCVAASALFVLLVLAVIRWIALVGKPSGDESKTDDWGYD